MLENERSFFLAVALEAGLAAVEGDLVHRAIQPGVRLVTIGAAHRLFRHSMVVWSREIGLSLNVAAETQIIGRLLEQLRRERALVDAVALHAGNTLLAMRAGAEAVQLTGVFVAGQTLTVVRAPCAVLLEGDDLGLVPPAVNMGLTGTVARLAGILEVELGALLQHCVGILVESLYHIFVADGAIRIAYATGLRSLPLLRGILSQQPARARGENPHQS
jgi:hypothetical protein